MGWHCIRMNFKMCFFSFFLPWELKFYVVTSNIVKGQNDLILIYLREGTSSNSHMISLNLYIDVCHRDLL